MRFHEITTLNDIVYILNDVIYIEEWRDIIGYEKSYQISSFGRIKSLQTNTKKERILSQNIVGNGYCAITLCINGILSKVLVHRLVGESFIKNPEKKPEINHINGIKTCNFIKNLEWATKSENGKHAYKIGLRKSTTYKFNKQVYQYDAKGELIAEFQSAVEAANRFGRTSKNIGDCCSGKTRSAFGYFWSKKKLTDEERKRINIPQKKIIQYAIR